LQQHDYIERMIAQVAAAIARAMGFAKSAQPEQAEREVAATWSGVIGLRRRDLDRLDPATLRALLGEKRLAAATLLEAEADIERSQGDLEAAARLISLATRLRA
jgi:hypothetical protein